MLEMEPVCLCDVYREDILNVISSMVTPAGHPFEIRVNFREFRIFRRSILGMIKTGRMLMMMSDITVRNEINLRNVIRWSTRYGAGFSGQSPKYVS
jgi:hypothetical protein